MEHFIETVRKYPCLWNTAAIEYRDQELKDAAWAEVLKETNLASVKDVKQKWKKLRDSYRDALKRQSDSLAKEPGGAARKNYPWKYMALMQFLQPHMSNRKKQPTTSDGGLGANGTNGASGPDRASSSSSDSDSGSSAKRKSCERLSLIDRKLDYLCEAQGKRRRLDCSVPGGTAGSGTAPAFPDPLDIFFNGMCQATKRFPYPTQIKIKRALFEAVTEAEEALVVEQQTYASLWAREAGSSSGSDHNDDHDRKPS